jgi:hypothetical protein
MFGKFESCGPDCTNPHPINTSGSLNMFKGPRPPFIRIRIFVEDSSPNFRDVLFRATT